MKQLIFDPKENNNHRREKEFLALASGKRIEEFLKMVGRMSIFPSKTPPKDKGNFVLYKTRKNNEEIQY